MPSWLGLYYEKPIELVRGEGRHVWDADSNRYLDFFGGILTTMTGHNVPEVVEAVQQQASKILHSSTLYLIRPLVELAEKIAELSTIPDAKVFFTNSGSEAVDTALLLACNARTSTEVLALRNSYHGRSFGALSVTGSRAYISTGLSPFRTSFAQNGYRLRSPLRDLDDANYIAACARDLRETIEMTTSGRVACLIAEPIQGVGGFTVPPDGFFRAYKDVLDDYRALFVSDEVQTGWGRTGEHFWGFQAHGIVPDILTFAKGLGNGLAIGGVVARGEIMDALPGTGISTFGGNPIATAGALANLQYLLDNDLQTNALKVGNRLLEGLRDVDARCVGEVRGKGLMIGVELCEPGSTNPDPRAASAVLEGARERGLLVGKGGPYGNVLRIAPPMSLTDEEAEEGLAILAAALGPAV